ncbi:MAG: pyruvate flavodoxin/ferredoxin oxidoreductase domain protein, partial [Proteobacteria bacterium]|nr:pyruvate flavodoxin/ferredoxin oxidoreductase domain protein [Pseudomonadota bacterium]
MQSLDHDTRQGRAAGAGTATSVSVAIAGSGGSGVMTAGTMLLDAAARAGLYGLMVRTSGPQIRGGEAAALLRFARAPMDALDDAFDLLLAMDWQNVNRFADEIPLRKTSLVVGDADEGQAPEVFAASGASCVALPLKKMAKALPGSWTNMLALGLAGGLAGIPESALEAALRASWKRSDAGLQANLAALRAGLAEADKLAGGGMARLAAGAAATGLRWLISGNEAAGYGALRAGVRFVAAYPITPATELLEWMAPALTQVGGTLLQAEDELASVNMIIGASYGGVPSLTATAGPGLALMTEAIGLAVSAEVPIVVVDVMRGGPSTGIPAKSEQSDLSFAVSGLHGDAPRLVLAPTSIADCLATTHWAVQLAEALQAPAIVLSDQFMGQSRAIIDRPAEDASTARRLTAVAHTPDYKRYRDTPSGVSPMATPGTPGTTYTADGLEHSEAGIPSSQARDHRLQLDKRERKLVLYDYGERWADIDAAPAGAGALAVITFGSITGSVREAVARAAALGVHVRLIALRLLAPALPERMAEALAGVAQVLVVEQNHGAQLYRWLRAMYDLPGRAASFHRPGPLPLRPAELTAAIVDWARSHQTAKEY